MISIEYKTLNSQSSNSPKGKNSFNRNDFAARFIPWRPDWQKIVKYEEFTIRHNDLPLAKAVYKNGLPTEYNNNETILMFEKPDCYLIVKSDFYTRLLFTEQKILSRNFELSKYQNINMNQVLAGMRNADDQFWSLAGLPGVPIAIGVNGSIRTTSSEELLAFKLEKAAAEMGGTVGPPVSAAANIDKKKDDIKNLTLGDLVDNAFEVAWRRELNGIALPEYRRRCAWLDSGRGYKPEVNYSCSIVPECLNDCVEALQKTHAGVLIIRGHLDKKGELTGDAEKEFENWGLNFQAWFLWQS